MTKLGCGQSAELKNVENVQHVAGNMLLSVITSAMYVPRNSNTLQSNLTSLSNGKLIRDYLIGTYFRGY